MERPYARELLLKGTRRNIKYHLIMFYNLCFKFHNIDGDMQRFLRDMENHRLLPRMDFFGALVQKHHKQAIGLYKFFYYATAWTTFEKNVCWARKNINPGMFVYALNLAVKQRQDCRHFSLPPMYEIFPQHFLNSQVIHRALTFRKEQWENVDEDLDARRWIEESVQFLSNWKPWQWWRVMGMSDERFYMELKSGYSLAKNKEFVMKRYWTPVDYTRNVYILNPETRLSYLLEDVELNNMWYDFNLEYPTFHVEGSKSSTALGSEWIYAIGRLMAIYKMARLSEGLDVWEDITLKYTIATGYNPQLVSWNGQTFWQRYNNYEYGDYGFPKTIDLVFKLTNEIYRLADTGLCMLENGTIHDLHQPAAVVDFSNILHDNHVALTPQDNETYWHYSFMYLAQIEFEQFNNVGPHVLVNFETMLRDPLFYSLMQYKVLDMWRRYIRNLPAYTKRELEMPGIRVQAAAVSPLVTYFDYMDIDLSNLWQENLKSFDQRKDGIYARQQHLTHKPYNFTLQIYADNPVAVKIHIFIAPKYNERHELLTLRENRENFILVDAVDYTLETGNNAVIWHSPDLKRRWSYSEMRNYVEGVSQNRLDASDALPQFNLRDSFAHFVIPKGNEEGFPYRNEYTFDVPNVYFKDAQIYHVGHSKNIEDYVRKYEKFGEFDYKYWDV
ncbi:unnamed protein product [Ceratitis capitata]|uniref:(Mediterranean fruit fly) hypothetical protein n=1 Tax=Ceratitis capitata TaxID=7213 RepID=A0A811V406_CERCA|nr:unnamed protein product [Ceratitis capitata]